MLQGSPPEVVQVVIGLQPFSRWMLILSLNGAREPVDQGWWTQIHALVITGIFSEECLLSILPQIHQNPFVSALTISWACSPRKQKRRRKAKQYPFLNNDVISTLKLWVAKASCHCVLVSFRMSCLGGGKGVVGVVVGKRTWLPAIALQMKVENVRQATWICTNSIF